MADGRKMWCFDGFWVLEQRGQAAGEDEGVVDFGEEQRFDAKSIPREE